MSKLDRRPVDVIVEAVAQRLINSRILIGIAGPPGSGKSTLAEAVVDRFNDEAPNSARLVPMDGFHLDNSILDERGIRSRKGAPDTFDATGFVAMLDRIRTGNQDIYVPVFDRHRDIAVANAQHVPAACSVVVIEGNYLLLDEEPWSRCAALLDLTVYLDVSMETLKQRLVQRWLDQGMDLASAEVRAISNDIPNATYVVDKSIHADLVFDET